MYINFHPPPFWSRRNCLKNSFTRFKQLFLVLLTGVLAFGCDSETFSSAAEDPVSASITPGADASDPLNPHNHRSGMIPFSIQATNAAAEGEYRLALRAADQATPTAAELRSAAASIVRDLSTTTIYVFLAFQMDTTLFDAALTNPVSYTSADGAMLKPSTAYKLYAVAESGSDEVYTLLTHSTDAEPPLSLVTDQDANGMLFHNVPIEKTYTIRKGEPFIFPVRIVNNSVAISIKDFGFRHNNEADTLSVIFHSTVAPVPTFAGPDNSLFFTKEIDGSIMKIAVVSREVLTNTASYVSGTKIQGTYEPSGNHGLSVTTQFVFE